MNISAKIFLQALIYMVVVMVAPFTFSANRASLDTDEAGLWMIVDKYEQELRMSSRNIKDPELEYSWGDWLTRSTGWIRRF